MNFINRTIGPRGKAELNAVSILCFESAFTSGYWTWRQSEMEVRKKAAYVSTWANYLIDWHDPNSLFYYRLQASGYYLTRRSFVSHSCFVGFRYSRLLFPMMRYSSVSRVLKDMQRISLSGQCFWLPECIFRDQEKKLFEKMDNSFEIKPLLWYKQFSRNLKCRAHFE